MEGEYEDSYDREKILYENSEVYKSWRFCILHYLNLVTRRLPLLGTELGMMTPVVNSIFQQFINVLIVFLMYDTPSYCDQKL